MITQYKYIDSHLHLQDKRIIGRVAEIIRDSQKAGVGAMFCNATSEGDWLDVLGLKKANATVFPFLGIHPWYAASLSPNWLADLESLLPAGAAGIGETGLDKTRPDFPLQTLIFQKQLKLAETMGLPVSIHCVGAWGKLLEILSDTRMQSFNFMVHGFAGSLEIMQRLVKMGAFISFSPMLAHPSREKLRRVFIQTPLERILLETDAPNQFWPNIIYNSNHGQWFKEKKLSHPLAVISLYEYAAGLRGMTTEDLAEALWKNGTIFTN